MAVQDVGTRAVEAYMASKEFEAEIVDGASSAFVLVFDLCKVQVAHLYPGVDVSRLNPEESGDKAEEARSRVASGLNLVVEAEQGHGSN